MMGEPSRVVIILCVGVLGLISGACISPFPVHRHEVLSVSRDGTSRGYDREATETTLRIQWLGTACHSIALDDVSVLTDPFISYQRPFRVLLGKLRVNPRLVERWTGHLGRPAAVFVGHSHYDHLLDLAEIRRQRGWAGVPIVGGETTRNLLASYRTGIEQDHRPVQLGGEWTALSEELAYKAFTAEHAPQLPNLLLYPGHLTNPLDSPPVRAGEFRCGDTYAYLFRFKKGDEEFTVYFVGAGSTPPIGLPPEDVGPVDVVILCVPSWKNLVDYPGGVIRRLKPRQIILSHFDDFLQPGRVLKSVLPTADLKGFIREALKECTYPGFERICVPDVGAVVSVGKR